MSISFACIRIDIVAWRCVFLVVLGGEAIRVSQSLLTCLRMYVCMYLTLSYIILLPYVEEVPRAATRVSVPGHSLLHNSRQEGQPAFVDLF
ncbi:hypothetical protein B0T19DRAFT_414550 [Cercophora scortea]|uniref:Uncharacterized protein n=1 Tax=Cercophora scortea TaxID=314031 RepID=A0AAE0IVG5_9PEZI|nr:hypothetical protein B0T19DRAFT_414550 [Cercophora scortea]